MIKQDIELLVTILEIGYASIVEDFPGLPKQEWMMEVVETYRSDRDFWLAANPEGTIDQFIVQSVPSSKKDNPFRQAAENVMRRHRR
jgi:hypothetical protein